MPLLPTHQFGAMLRILPEMWNTTGKIEEFDRPLAGLLDRPVKIASFRPISTDPCANFSTDEPNYPCIRLAQDWPGFHRHALHGHPIKSLPLSEDHIAAAGTASPFIRPRHTVGTQIDGLLTKPIKLWPNTPKAPAKKSNAPCTKKRKGRSRAAAAAKK
jgi:hypothetical protein